MPDFLMKLNRNPATGGLARALGLPNPVELARAAGGYAAAPLAQRAALLARSPAGYAAGHLARALADAGAAVMESMPAGDALIDIVALDATGCRAPADCRILYDTFHPLARRIARNGRVLLVAANPDRADDAVAAAVARGIEGFSRSLGKELGRKGITVNLAYADRAAAERLAGPVRFFCSERATYVSGQALRLSSLVAPPAALPATQTLAGKAALVTGSARGIGRAIAERLAQEGAQVVCLDVPAAADALHESCLRIGALPLLLDITASGAPEQLAAFFRKKYGGLDILVHNAGVTRDRTLANLQEHDWDMVLNVNLAAIVAIDACLLAQGLLRDAGRIVCLSSISGIAGNAGQTNYATSKAALIGYVAAQAPRLAARAICINAVAPGFIDTAMTGDMPFMTRELARRLNSVQQGGQPRDVAELVAFLGTPWAYGISGETIRVCGQGLVGA